MKVRSALHWALLFLAATNNQAQTLPFNTIDLPPNPVLTLDQADYPPGDDARIFGSGFLPFETVSLVVWRTDTGPGIPGAEWSWSVAADAQGEMQTTWHVCEDGCENKVLELRAEGQTSGLVTIVSFSDGFIENGGFENPTLLGWSVVRSGEHQADWYSYGGTVSPISGLPIQEPPEGSRAMVTDHLGAGYQVLYQDLILEPGYNHSLSFEIYYQNRADAFYERDDFNPVGLNQQYRVDLIRPDAPILTTSPDEVLSTLFRTKQGDPLQLAPKLISADLTPFAGSIVRLRFGVVQALSFFQASVDNVQLASAPARCLSLQCPGEILAQTDVGQCGARVDYPLPVVSTACDGTGGALNPADVTVTCDPPSGSVFPPGTAVVRCVATDLAGNTATCSFNVTVRDLEAPVISVASGGMLQANPAAAEIAAAFGSASAADNCSTDLTPIGTLQPEEGTGCYRSVTKLWTATDVAGNLATASQTISFIRDIAPPIFQSLVGPTAPVPLGAPVTIQTSLLDACSDVERVTFDWNDGSEPTVVPNASTASATHQYTRSGIYTVRVTARDGAGNLAEESLQYLVVYDPASGSVTGGGGIQSRSGACAESPTLTDKASFGFVCKYTKNSDLPEGQTQYIVRDAEIKFHSDSYEWLVLNSGKAQFKGFGTLNGSPGYEFLVTAVDGQFGATQSPDQFRIKIWNVHGVVYDSGLGAPDESSTPLQSISQGSISIR